MYIRRRYTLDKKWVSNLLDRKLRPEVSADAIVAVAEYFTNNIAYGCIDLQIWDKDHKIHKVFMFDESFDLKTQKGIDDAISNLKREMVKYVLQQECGWMFP